MMHFRQTSSHGRSLLGEFDADLVISIVASHANVQVPGARDVVQSAQDWL